MFSIANWKALTSQGEQKHTLACCQECCNEYQVLQQSFPLKPCYLEEPLIVINKQEATRTALSELNDSFSGKFQSTFVDSVVTHGGQRLQVTPLSLSHTHIHIQTHTHSLSTVSFSSFLGLHLSAIKQAVQLLQIQEVHPVAHSSACKFCLFLSIFLTCSI